MSRFGKKSTAEQVSAGVDLRGKRALVTGANTGIGKETARVLALRGAHVTMACRDMRKAETARDEIVRSASGAIAADQLELLELDLNNLASIHGSAQVFIDQNEPLHLLVNNAGIMIPMERRTDDDFEAHLGVNHLGHFLFTRLLHERLQQAGDARLVVVSSAAMAFATLTAELRDLNWRERKHNGMRSYGDSKLMNMMFVTEFNRRYAGAGIVANALHPGVVGTDLARDQSLPFMLLGALALPFMKSIEQGAATTVYVATSEEPQVAGGGYYVNCQRRKQPDGKLALDEDACERLWCWSEQAVGLAG